MIRQAIITFEDVTSIGVDLIPNKSYVFINSLNLLFIKDNNTGLDNQSTLDVAIINGNLVEALV